LSWSDDKAPTADRLAPRVRSSGSALLDVAGHQPGNAQGAGPHIKAGQLMRGRLSVAYIKRFLSARSA
jgi:hypothetical protein